MIQSWHRISLKAAPVAALFLSLSLLLTSCNKFDDQIGFDLLPNTGQIHGILLDNLEVKAYTIPEDSLRVDSLTRSLLGAINDPIFGTSSANLYLQCLLKEINIDYGTSPKFDSIVLSLAIDQTIEGYGAVNDEIEVDIYKMAEILKRENKYYSNYSPAIGSTIGSWKGRLNKSDTTKYYDKGVLKSETALLRMKLNASFGESFFTAGAYGNNDAFLSFLNGIALIPKSTGLGSGEGRMAPIHLNSANSKLTIYFNDTLQKEFVISDQGERMMHYQIKNRSASITNQLINPGVHYSETYVQSLASCKTRIEIPDLLDIVQDGQPVLINEASITFTIQDGTTTTDFPAPSRMLLLQPTNQDGTGPNALIIDLIDDVAPPDPKWIGFTNYGGKLSTDGKTYTFRFNRHLQRMLDEYLATGVDNNRGFYLVIPSDNPITPSRVVLNTDNGSGQQNIALKITYTKL